MNKVTFYFDFLSPFSFFAWKNLKIFHPKLDLTCCPIPMGKLFKHHGFLGPGEIPAKRSYELKKCFRYCGERDWKFNPPEQFPFNPLAVLRAATAHAADTHQTRVIDLLFALIWEQAMVLDDPEKIKTHLDKIDKNIFERSFSSQARLELKSNIKQALEAGAFGVPSLIHAGELFWGNDSLQSLSNKLLGNDNWNRELYSSLREK